ncbi:chaplin [Streptomyces sp. AK02-01A]|uniref:chaplin n=1 Tax=Streptomyces sp. AK02-01A TaxID=3028648 RepID=UPI0029B104F3|nr:chaplin [Streptomyces sp. AK02-01A]MDX3851301.1 chaplin [Streptomyces sp. AK02-01A]
MRDLISKGLLTAAAATSVLSLGGAYAHAAESDGVAAGSPGLLSGNNVQAPVEIPVNVCGNTVNPVGALNPAFGNACANTSAAPQPEAGVSHEGYGSQQASGSSGGYGSQQAPVDIRDGAGGSSTSATSVVKGSPGVLSGNSFQAPVEAPLNVCGNSVNATGLLNPAFGNHCANGAPEVAPEPPRAPEVHTPEDHGYEPPAPVEPPAPEPVVHEPHEEPSSEVQLATTGNDSNLLAMAAMSFGLLIGGGVLYRRRTAAARV